MAEAASRQAARWAQFNFSSCVSNHKDFYRLGNDSDVAPLTAFLYSLQNADRQLQKQLQLRLQFQLRLRVRLRLTESL